MYLGYNLLISQRSIPINASFVAGITSSGLLLCLTIKVSFGCVHLLMLPLYNKQLAALLSYTNDALIMYSFHFYQVISRYHPNHSVTVWYQIYQPINFFEAWLHCMGISSNTSIVLYSCMYVRSYIYIYVYTYASSSSLII